jgi:hypothetical protein
VSDPQAAPDFDADKCLGTWFIVVTNYGYWKHRHNPTVTYEPMAGDVRTWRDTLRFTSRGIFGGKAKPGKLGGVDRELSPGRFVWRGDGLLSIIKSPWWVMLVDPAGEWAVTYFGRSNVGTAPGMDIYGRKPDMPREQIAKILATCRAHPFLAQHCNNLYATVQGTLPVDRYDLG